jgi:class 3 adenylate cyclase
LDIHKNVRDTTPQDVAAAHHLDVEAQGAYGVKFLRWWFNQELGSLYCLVDAPSAKAANDVHAAAHGLLADEIIPVEAGAVDDFIGPDEHGQAYREDPPDRISTDTVFRTIVFTDLEDSTPLTQRLGDDAYVQLLRTHDDLMATCLDANSGLHVKHMGDGVMASFVSVAKAVQCMIDMQRALAEHNAARPEAALVARMGAAAGEPVSHQGDLFGAAVNLAARLSSHAAPGQIVVAGVVRDLCIGKTFAFQDQGEIELKGFNEPVRVYGVNWQQEVEVS